MPSFFRLASIAAACFVANAAAQDPTLLGTRVLVGDEACPVTPPGSDVTATVLASVQLDEVVTASLDVIGADLLTAEVQATLNICLCVDADVETSLIELPVDLRAAALADIELAASAAVDVTTNLVTFLGLVNSDNPLVNVDLDITPISSNPCLCPVDATPICNQGTCGCQCNDAGFFYNPSAGENGACVLIPSMMSRRLRTRDSAIVARQATRAQVASSQRQYN